jgi:hypothetical protein
LALNDKIFSSLNIKDFFMDEGKKKDLAETFIDDYEECLKWLQEVTSRLETVQLTQRQKAQIAGFSMGVAHIFTTKINKKLIEWGFLAE